MPKALLLLVILTSVLQGFFYYEAIHILHLVPLYPYPMSIAGSLFMVAWPLWLEHSGQTRAAYLWSLLACLVGIGMCTYGLSP